jgi:hypothetical protein
MSRLRVLLAVIAVFGLAVIISCITLERPRSASRLAKREKSVPVEPASSERIAAHEPAEGIGTSADSAEPERDPIIQRTFSRLLSAGRTRGQISRPVLDAFLASTQRRATALLVASRELEDPAYLEEAAAKFPDDPRVQFVMMTEAKSAEERDRWIAAFQKSAPDNSLPDYFRAILSFEQKDDTAAFKALAEAAGKSTLEDYSWDFSDEMETLYLQAGMPPGEAKATASYSILLPHLQMLRELGRQISEAQTATRSMGNANLANELLAADVELGRTLAETPGRTLIHQLVGIAIQKNAIATAEPTAIDMLFGQPPPTLLVELQATRDHIIQSSQNADIESLIHSDADLGHYFDLVRSDGELAAIEWLTGKAPPQEKK